MTAHLDALAKANATRLARMEIRRHVRGLDTERGKATAADLIEEPPPELERTTVFDLLGWIFRYGRLKSLHVLMRCGVGELTEIGSLTARQRAVLVADLRGESEEAAA